MNKRVAQVASIVVLSTALIVVPAALGGKGKPGNRGATSSTIRLVVLTSPDGLPHLGGQVTFDVFTTATTTPWVNVNCRQNGTVVYSQWHGFFTSYRFGQTFDVGPTMLWQSGDADCTADLIKRSANGKKTKLATTSFHAYG